MVLAVAGLGIRGFRLADEGIPPTDAADGLRRQGQGVEKSPYRSPLRPHWLLSGDDFPLC